MLHTIIISESARNFERSLVNMTKKNNLTKTSIS